MPFVEVKLIGKLTPEQKSKIVAEMTDTLHRIAGKAPEATLIRIEEGEPDCWGQGGRLFSEKK